MRVKGLGKPDHGITWAGTNDVRVSGLRSQVSEYS